MVKTHVCVWFELQTLKSSVKVLFYGALNDLRVAIGLAFRQLVQQVQNNPIKVECMSLIS